jgi:hypothetical protein
MSLFVTKQDRSIIVVMAVLISVLLTDTMINQVSDFLARQLTSNFGLITFIVFGAILGISQFFILKYVKQKISSLYSGSPPAKYLHSIVTIMQYLLLGIITALIIQTVFDSFYFTYFLIAITAISYSLNISLMGYFAKKLISWYLLNRYSIVVLLYGISFIFVAITSLMAFTLDTYNLSLKPTQIYPTSEVVFPSYDEGTITIIYVFHLVYRYFDLFSFLLVWGSTALLLHGYIQKWKARHWLLICLPLVYYLSTIIDFFGLYTPSSDSEWFSYYLYISLNTTAGGIFFGFAFLIVARNVHNELIRGFIVITAFGFVLLFISNQVTLVATSFPPFGTVTISYFGLSSYLILIGLYSTALSMSQDVVLRKSIKKSLLDKSRLLGGIGTAEMQKEIEKWATSVHGKDDKMRVPPSMTEYDVKSYIQQVVKEIKAKEKY